MSSVPAFAQSDPLEIIPGTLEFNGVKLFDAKDLNVRIRNISGGDLEILDIQMQGNNTADFAVQGAKSFILPNGATKNIIVRFSPQAIGDRITVMTFLTDAGDQGVALHGTGEENKATLIFSTTAIDFGKHDPSYLKDSVIYLVNQSDISATINELEVANQSGQQIFSVTPEDASVTLPYDLSGHDTLPLRIRAKGQLPIGLKQGYVTAHGNFGGATTVTFSLEIGQANADINTTFIDLGNVNIGEEYDTTIVIVSTGEVPLVITDLGALPPGVEILNPPTIPYTLPVGDTLRLRIRIVPQKERDFITQFTLTFADVATGGRFKVISIQGNGLPINLTVNGEKALFFECAKDSVLLANLTIQDTGASPITIDSAAFSDNAFTLVSPLPIVLQPGGSRQIQFRVKPTGPAHHAQLILFKGRAPIYSDSLHVQTAITSADSKLSIANNLVSEEQPQKTTVQLSLAKDLTAYNVNVLDIALTFGNRDIFDLDGTSIAVNQTLLPNGVASISLDTITGVWHITVTAPQGLQFDPATAPQDQPFLTFDVLGYVSTDTVTDLTASISAIGKEGCLEISSSVIPLTFESACVDSILRHTLHPEPLIISSSLSPNPVHVNGLLHLDVELSKNASLVIEVIDQRGNVVNTNAMSGFKGNNRFDYSNLSSQSGTYLIRITATASTGEKEVIIRKIVIL